MAVPNGVARLLLGVELSASGIAVARIAGLGLFSFGLTCWPRGDDTASQITQVLFLFNLLMALYLGYLRVAGGFVGLLLWPACALHVLLTLLLARSVYQQSRVG